MWVTRGSYVGHIRIAQWVKWISKRDPLSTLSACMLYVAAIRPGKVDLQFIVRAFPKMHAGGRSFFIFHY